MEISALSSINITAYPNSYPIYIGNYLESNLLTQYINKNSQVIVIYDEKLKNTFLPLLLNRLTKFVNHYTCFSLKSTEKNKNFKTINYLVNKILDFNINRLTTIISLGGGIIGDIAGFVSAILLRGIKLINIPTTLLSAVDSSVGSKNGVNHRNGKNLIGTFYNPEIVIIDPVVFTTLSKRHMLSGFAEVIKCSLINNQNFFNYLNNNYALLLKKDLNLLKTIITQSILIKKDLVEQDYFDTQNLRALLNLGHTFGHALELTNNYHNSITHGEAVAFGLCMAAKFSLYMGLLNTNIANKIIHFIHTVGLDLKVVPLYNNSILQQKFILAMLKDKKNTSQNINLILLKDIGQTLLVKDIPITKIINFFNSEYCTWGAI